jgi:hypothetical protein
VSPHSFVAAFELVISYDFKSLICISQERESVKSYVRWVVGT